MDNSIQQVLNILNKISSKKVAVIGDIFLDEYIYGKVNKVSSGIKIPIIEKEQSEYRLGGAANVAANIAGLCNDTILIGCCGKDDAGITVERICKRLGITLYSIYVEKTTVKQRIYIDNQQVSRLDINYESESIIDNLNQILLEIDADVFVIADYLYGVISQEVIDEVVSNSKDKNIPLLITSRNLGRFILNDVPIIVVNQKEWIDYNNNTDVTDGKKAFITLGGKGIRYVSSTEKVEQNTMGKNPVNVSGAGDTVLAIISLLIGESLSIKTILNIANVAGGIAVSNELTYVISQTDLIEALYNQKINVESENKIVHLRLAIDIINTWKAAGRKIVFTNGCYDLLHLGHIKSFQYAKQFGDKLIVAVNSDESIKRLKGNGRPINSLGDRVSTLSYLGMIDMVIPFDDDTAINVIRAIEPDIYIKGEEYKNKKLPEAEYVKRVEFVPMIQGTSTTQMIKKILKVTDI